MPAPDQVIVNEYAPGQGIGAHTDDERRFGPCVVGVSLGSACTLTLQHKATHDIVAVTLPRRSAYKLEGNARYAWTHAIPARKSDAVDGKRTLRGTRISVTFRVKK